MSLPIINSKINHRQKKLTIDDAKKEERILAREISQLKLFLSSSIMFW